MFRRKQPDILTTEARPCLPSDVKFALKYRDAMLRPADIAKLFGNGLGHLGFYMSMKAGSDNDTVQADLIKKASERNFDLGCFTKADAADALDHLASQNPAHVEGQKLRPVDSVGIDYWKSRFRGVLGPALSQNPNASLFMVANAPYIAFDEIAAASLMRGHSLGILKPNRFGQSEKSVGFMIEPGAQGINVNLLSSDFTRPESAVVFDDAMASGNVRERVLSFWGSDSRPNFIAAFVDGSAIALNNNAITQSH